MNWLKDEFEANRYKYKCQAAESIGNEMKVRISKVRGVTKCFAGTIISAEPLQYRLRGRSAVVQFEVVLENKRGVRRVFTLEKLPR